jgi:Fe-S cluster assembly iron-binding protein IscA
VIPKARTTPLHPLSRPFSTSSPRRATHAIYNPQVDDDGKDMVLEITQRAAKRLSQIMAKDANPNLALRIQVESGGCHGFQYLMKLVTLPPSLPTQKSSPPGTDDDSAAIHEDDTIFTYAPDGNLAEGDLTAPKIILDFPSLELLKGSKVDFTMELIGSQFKIVDNPLATSSCGCGTSFDIKV